MRRQISYVIQIIKTCQRSLTLDKIISYLQADARYLNHLFVTRSLLLSCCRFFKAGEPVLPCYALLLESKVEQESELIQYQVKCTNKKFWPWTRDVQHDKCSRRRSNKLSPEQIRIYILLDLIQKKKTAWTRLLVKKWLPTHHNPRIVRYGLHGYAELKLCLNNAKKNVWNASI